MTLLSVPWLELAVALPLFGAIVIGRIRDPIISSNWSMAFTATTFALCLAAWAAFSIDPTAVPVSGLTLLIGRPVLMLDQLNAPLVPGIALLHFLTGLGTARTKMARFSISRLLLGAAIRIATFACVEPIDLCVLLMLGIIPPYLDLRARKKPTGVYLFHMGLFVVLLIGGLVASGTLAATLMMGAVLVRSGTVPLHVWIRDLFENASLGTSLLTVAPIVGMYAALRLVLPAASPDWVLQGIGMASLVTAIYAAGMAVVQNDSRRFLAYLVISHAGLVMVGMELHTVISLTGALSLWASVVISLMGVGLTLRSLEARFDRLPLTEFRGLYSASPVHAIIFLLTGLATVGFPGTSGFLAIELLIDGALSANPLVGVAVVIATALNGVAVVRAYFVLFTGTRHVSGVPLGITIRERVAVYILSAFILIGGFFPQILIDNRYHAAEHVLAQRNASDANHTE